MIFARLAVSANPATAASAIAELRANGPDGLQVLLSAHAEMIRTP